ERVDSAQDVRRLVASADQIREPERQAIEHDDVRFDAREQARYVEWLFERFEIGAAIAPMPGDAIAHLVVARFGRSDERPPGSAPSREPEGEVAFARPRAASDEDHALHGQRAASFGRHDDLRAAAHDFTNA